MLGGGVVYGVFRLKARLKTVLLGVWLRLLVWLLVRVTVSPGGSSSFVIRVCCGVWPRLTRGSAIWLGRPLTAGRLEIWLAGVDVGVKAMWLSCPW